MTTSGEREQFMPRVKGKPFRCECGCNVFHKDEHGCCVCNACNTAYGDDEAAERYKAATLRAKADVGD